jgi:hypothetical protein
MKTLTSGLLWIGVGLLGWGCAHSPGGKSSGTSVHVTVLDNKELPIVTAVIRHPREAERHRVNSVDGSWEEDELYLPDGSSLVFEPGMILELEISAPGYVSQTIEYEMVKRKNVLSIHLQKLDLGLDDVGDEIELGFGRDTPIEGGAVGGPSN